MYLAATRTLRSSLVFVGVFVLISHVAQAGDGCPCNGDVNDDGDVNVNDATAITECVLGDCGNCVNSCDVNCDGRINFVDLGVQWCQFELGSLGSPESCCDEPTGACVIPEDRFDIFPPCFLTLRGACEFFAVDQNENGAYLGDGTTLAACKVPTVSEWGLVVLTLALMVFGTIIINRIVPRFR